MSHKLQPTPTGVPRQSTTVDLLFEPTGDLEKDYCAYCEIEDKNDRDDIIEGILREELDSQATPLASSHAPMSAHSNMTSAPNGEYSVSESTMGSPHLSQHYSQHTLNNTSTSAPMSAHMAGGGPQVPIIRTTINLRNLSYCLNRRDMQPLADAIPHCPSLTAIRMTGCGLTEHSYKQLVEAVYKSGSIHTLAVDMNPDGLFKDPTVSRKSDRNEINVYAAEYKGAHLRPADERDEAAGAGGAGAAKRAPPKPSRPAAVTKKTAAQLAAAEAADRTPIPLPTGWHAALFTGLQVLSLRGNGITDQLLEPLCDMLATNTELLSLSLWGNRITSAGAAMLAKALSQNGRLITLNLGHNQICDEGVKELMGMFLSRDVPYDELCRLRTKAHALLAATSERDKPMTAPSAPAAGNSAAALAAAAAAAANPLPPVEPPLFPGYGDITAAAMAKQVEEGTIASIKALGIPISSTTGQAPAAKKKEGPSGGKKKGMGEGPLERPSDPFDRDVVRLYEDPIVSPATTSLIAQQLSVAMTSSSAAAVQAAIVQLQQLSKFRVPGNTVLAALNLSFNPGITAKGLGYAAAVLRTREPTPEGLFAQLTQGATGLDFQQATSSPPSNAKGAPPTPSTTMFGAPVSAAIPTLAGHQGLSAPAANATAIAAQVQSAIMSAPHLHQLNSTAPYMTNTAALRQLDIESSKIEAAALAQLQAVVKERRAFLAERKLAESGSE